MTYEEIIRKNDWFIVWSREYGILRMDNYARGLGSSNDYFDFHFQQSLSVWKEGFVDSYLDRSEEKIFRELICQKIKTITGYREFEKTWLRNFSAFLNYTKKIPKNLTSKTNSDLVTILREHDRLHLPIALAQFIIWTGNEMVAEAVEKLLYKKTGNDQAMMVFSRPIEFNATTSLEIELLRSRISDNSDRELDKVYQKYFWMSVNDPVDSIWPKDKFLEAHKVVLEIKKPEAELKKIFQSQKELKEQQKSLLTNLKLDLTEKTLLKVFFRLLVWKDRRDDFRGGAYAYSQRFYEEIAKRVGLTRKELQRFLIGEIIEALSKGRKLDPKIAGDRKRLSAVLCIDNQTSFIKIVGNILPQSPNNDLGSIVRGTVGCKGVVTGPAKLVIYKDDLYKIKQGDVLVAVTTHPDFVPAMRLASAIVTDEGGITSHAAITSREFKKPCIVGTKNATKVLRDGDLVEVDADKGVVKKL